MMTMSVFLPCSQYCEISIFNFFLLKTKCVDIFFFCKVLQSFSKITTYHYRQQVQDREAEYEEKKHAYDTLSLQLESSMSRVEQEVKKFQEEILANETRHQLLELRNRNLELLLQRAHDEIKLYVSNKAEDKKKSVREQLLKQASSMLEVVVGYSQSQRSESSYEKSEFAK